MAELSADFSFLEKDEVSRVVVGLSGGIDSIVLLDAVSSVMDVSVVAVHVNHHLHNKADEAADFCVSLGEKYGITVEVIDVDVSDTGSMEARAREARYSAFTDFLKTGDVLLLAHHADDQAETALFRLFRGSRVFGLEGMPRSRPLGKAQLCRPLLDVGREDIEAFAQARGLSWFEDPTNSDVTPDRNFIRHELMPMISARFPGARRAILAAVEGDARARAQLSDSWLSQLIPHLTEADALDLDWLSEQPKEKMSDLLTAWMQRLDVPQPSGRFLEDLAEKVSRYQTVDEVIGDYCLHSFDGCLYLGRHSPESHVANDKVKGKGLRYGEYDIRYRSGGEKMVIRHTRSLKNLFQEQRVPPWLRDRMPLVYSGTELVAIAALPGWGIPMLVADGWHAGSGEDGLEISIQLGDRIR
ncbi:MAG: tRNA lysidine(34) synthetase TilS [Pseudomonadales bacterium]|nr:tRNA lysidine(34) synthetase TilS [Pseudomonadales bacterium]MBO6596197.1 tRNA lysidine(34) synthetase TilS [Pseudomonadales bacterium]MBO6822677.1 tRNA lysidine(34) synthetase TilS [Pseudomonadales bacterium]